MGVHVGLESVMKLRRENLTIMFSTASWVQTVGISTDGNNLTQKEREMKIRRLCQENERNATSHEHNDCRMIALTSLSLFHSIVHFRLAMSNANQADSNVELWFISHHLPWSDNIVKSMLIKPAAVADLFNGQK